MTQKELLNILEIHQGNEWRNLTFLIGRLPISDEKKEEVEKQALAYGEAVVAYQQRQTESEYTWWIGLWETIKSFFQR